MGCNYCSTKPEIILFSLDPEEDEVHVVRMLTYIPGIVFHKIPYTAEMLHEVGRHVGRLDKVLRVLYRMVFFPFITFCRMNVSSSNNYSHRCRKII